MTRVGTGFFTMSSFRGARCPLSRAEKSSLVLRAMKYQGTPSFPRTRWLPDEPSKAYHTRRKVFGLRIVRAQPFGTTDEENGSLKTPTGLRIAPQWTRSRYTGCAGINRHVVGDV